jgi:hypothetical protein
MSLTTGRRLVRNHWTTLPLPQDVVERLRDRATREQRSLAARQRTGPGLAFLNRNQQAIDEEDDLLIAGVGTIDNHIAGVNAYDDANNEAYDDIDQQYDVLINVPDNNVPEPEEHDPHYEPPFDAAEAPFYQPPVDAAEAPPYDHNDVIANDELDQPEQHNGFDAAEAYDAEAQFNEVPEAPAVPLEPGIDAAHDEALLDEAPFNDAPEAPAAPMEPGIAEADINKCSDLYVGPLMEWCRETPVAMR